MDEDEGAAVPEHEAAAEAETARHFWNWITSYDPAVMAEALRTHGSAWTDAHCSASTLRRAALADHEPDDGTPEGEELAAIHRRLTEYEEAAFGADDDA